MNRKLNLHKSAEARTIGSISAALGKIGKKQFVDRHAKVYLIYDGDKLECWFLDFNIEGGNDIETTAGVGQVDSQDDSHTSD